MINANELRIGNLVSYNGTSSYGEVGTVSITELRWRQANTWQDMGASGGMYYDEIEPIPITVEWLLKLGFKQSGHDYLIEVDNRVYSFMNNKLIYEVYNDDEVDEITINTHPLKYVHQLQNLYFALTGKELEYDNKK